MTIITTGAAQNSYITISEANALLLTMAASFLTTSDTLLTGGDDDRYLIEAASDLESLWRWTGVQTDNAQMLAWPRKFVAKPGWMVPLEPGWYSPYNESAFLEYKILYLSGTQYAAWLDKDTVPKNIKEAQALLAILRKQGRNLVGDNKGDAQGTRLGSLHVNYVNAIRDSADIHKRTAQLGSFIGDGIMRTPNGV